MIHGIEIHDKKQDMFTTMATHIPLSTQYTVFSQLLLSRFIWVLEWSCLHMHIEFTAMYSNGFLSNRFCTSAKTIALGTTYVNDTEGSVCN